MVWAGVFDWQLRAASDVMTEYLQVDPDSPDPEALARAATVLTDGGIVAFPTETVYGLGAAAPIASAVERLRDLKSRPADQPFTYLLPDTERLADLVPDVSSRAQALMNRYWPGPLTLVLRSGDEHVGVRVPANETARRMLQLAETLVLAPSANPRDEPPATTADEVRGILRRPN